jgi:hypothetical protein
MARWPIFLFLFLSSLSAAWSKNGGTEDTTVYYEETDVWYGPGFYNGIWFGSEDDFVEWNNTHYHDYNHQHINGGQDHRQMEDRGGGGRMGGGGRR